MKIAKNMISKCYKMVECLLYRMSFDAYYFICLNVCSVLI